MSKERPQNSLNRLNFSVKKNVPVVMQSEIADCGIASLAMISNYYGHKVNLISLRQMVSVSSNGMTLRQIMNVASRLAFACRAVQCPLEDLDQLKLPCLLHWDLEHFVVLTSVKDNTFCINDPAIGKRKLNKSMFSQSYTGIALELTPTTTFKKKDSQVVMKIHQLWEKMIGLKRSLIALFALSIIIQIILLMSPYYMQWTVDKVLLSNDKPFLVVLALGFVMLTMIQAAVGAFRSWLVLRLSSTLNLQMGSNLFHHLLRLPISYFEKRHIGDIVSRFDSLSSIKEMLTTKLVESIIDGLMATSILVVMYMYSAQLSLVVIAIVTISIFVRIFFFFPNRKFTEELIVASAKEDSTFLESIRAIQTIKLFSYEANRQNTWMNYYAEVINANLRLGKTKIAEATINNILFGIENILVIYLGAISVMNGYLTTGMLIAFMAYKSNFTSSITTFIAHLLDFKLLGLHLQRLSDITLNEKEMPGGDQSTSLEHVKGNIVFENVSFRYSDDSDWILRDLSFEIKSGESVAITGNSGCGKTTLVKILLGLLKPSSGKVYLDGIDTRELPISDYRSYFGSVMQNDTLLSGTLIDNITMFEGDFDYDRVMKCCRDACILDKIISLPMSFNSPVGDMGNTFSGGQLQRIFLARALYREPKILCLDESTSHLDRKNEAWINENINNLNITKIIVAHRQETIKYSSRVICLS